MDKKFTSSLVVNDWEVETEDGFKDIMSTHKTIPYKMFYLETESFSLKCADHHIVFKENYEEVLVEDLKVGDYIFTKNGLEKVCVVEDLKSNEVMYDIQVNHSNESYYTNGILSHNTATAALYLLWYAMFNSDKEVLVTSYKWSGVDEVMSRIRYAYESCPDHIRCGATTYSSKKIVFDNNSSITGQTTSENTGRGLSISLLYCLDGNSTVTLKDKVTGEIKNISLENLYNEFENDMIVGIASKPKLRMQFADGTFMDVDEDTSFYRNGGTKTTIENLLKGDFILFGDEELEVYDIYLLDADGDSIV